MTIDINRSLETNKTLEKLSESELPDHVFFQHLLRFLTDESIALAAIAWNIETREPKALARYASVGTQNIPMGMNDKSHRAALAAATNGNETLLVRLDEKSTIAQNKSPLPLTFPSIGFVPATIRKCGILVELLFPPDADDVTCKQSLEKTANLLRPISVSNDGSEDGNIDNEDANSSLDSLGENSESFQTSIDQLASTIQSQLGLGTANNSLSQFISELHGSIDLRETTYRIANETRAFLGCDRVVVFKIHRGKFRVEAINGQPNVNRKAEQCKRVQQLGQSVLQSGNSLIYPDGDDQTLPVEIEKPLNEYLTHSVTRSLAIIPITNIDPPEDSTVVDNDRERIKVIGGILIEQNTQNIPAAEIKTAVSSIDLHIRSAFRAAFRHQQLFLYPLWKTLGKSKIVLASRHLPKTILASVALLITILFLTFWPARFHVTCSGVLVPRSSANVFALVDGQIVEVLASHGQNVEEGQPLARMVSNQLGVRIQEVSGQIESLKKRIETIDTLLLGKNRRSPQQGFDSETIRIERSSLSAQLDSLGKQLEILNSDKRKLQIESPISGTVTSWNVEELLGNRPVVPGKVLMEVADTAGMWELELDLPDKRIGHVLGANDKHGERLEVSFVLAADPTRRYQGHVTEMSNSTNPTSEDGQTIRLIAAFDNSQFELKQVRTEVTAKIYCGRRSLGYVWLHDVFDFMHRKVWFRFW